MRVAFLKVNLSKVLQFRFQDKKKRHQYFNAHLKKCFCVLIWAFSYMFYWMKFPVSVSSHSHLINSSWCTVKPSSCNTNHFTGMNNSTSSPLLKEMLCESQILWLTRISRDWCGIFSQIKIDYIHTDQSLKSQICLRGLERWWSDSPRCTARV